MPIRRYFEGPNIDPSSKHVLPVTPSDADELPFICRYLVAAVAGNIAIVTEHGDDVVIPVAAGHLNPVFAKQVKATSTTAAGIVAYF
jgi:hypothetical protein